ncbi:MAG: hypothetical protein KDE08_07420 [Rhodobacteraceae bacterium]|nr:hypothetical protein [Paracoccaceae bacterium]
MDESRQMGDQPADRQTAQTITQQRQLDTRGSLAQQQQQGSGTTIVIEPKFTDWASI